MSAQRVAHSSLLLDSVKSSGMKPAKGFEMENMRSRRARLKGLTTTIRLPPLAAGSERRPRGHPSSLFHHGTSRFYGKPGEQYHRRRRGPAMSAKGGGGPQGPHPGSAMAAVQSETTKLPTLDQPPITPYHNPLPGIGEKGGKGEAIDGAPAEAKADPLSPPSSEDQTDKDDPESAEKESPPDIGAAGDRPESAKSAKLNMEAGDNDSESETDSKEPDFAGLVSQMGDDVTDKRLQGTAKARKFLSNDAGSPHIGSFLEAGILKPCTESLQIDNTDLQFEALWVLTNIASGTTDQARAVVDSGAIPLMTGFLKSPEARLREQSLWSLSNIAGDSYDLCKILIDEGVVDPVLELLQDDMPLSLRSNFAWMLSNLVRHKVISLSTENGKFLKKILQAAGKLLYSGDVGVIVDCLWTISYIDDGPNDHIQLVIDEGLCPKMVEYISHREIKVVMPAVRACGNIATGTDEQTQAVMDAGILRAIHPHLDDGANGLKKEVLWLLSNITAGTQSQAQEVVDAGLLSKVVRESKEGTYEVKKEGIWTMSNLTTNSNRQQIQALVDAEGMEVFLDVLRSVADGMILEIALDGICNTLKALVDTPSYDEVKGLMDEQGGTELLEMHLSSEKGEVSSKARFILETYYCDDSVSEDEWGVNMTKRIFDEASDELQEKQEQEEREKEEKDKLEIEEDAVSKMSDQALKYVPGETVDDQENSGAEKEETKEEGE